MDRWQRQQRAHPGRVQVDQHPHRVPAAKSQQRHVEHGEALEPADATMLLPRVEAMEALAEQNAWRGPWGADGGSWVGGLATGLLVE